MSHQGTGEHPTQQQQQQPTDITSLQENFSKQQEKISALKELVRKSEAAHGKSTSSTQEKVKNIALRLTNLKSKARSRQNLDSSTTSLNDAQFPSQENLHLLQSQCSTTTDAGGGDITTTPHRRSSVRLETPGSEKILLLRKQMEENKVKMAERENSKREIEHMVTQLKAKFDTTQQCLEHSSELGRSMGDLSALSYSSKIDKVRSATDLASAPFNLDKERIKFLDNRVRLLEKQLEKEKSSSDASKRVKELENKVLELEEALKDQRTRDLVAALNDPEVEESWQIENDRLKTELEEKTRRIFHLEEVNDVLETAKCDLTEKLEKLESKLKDSEEKSKQLEAELEKLKATVDMQKFEMVDDADIERQVEQELVRQVQQLESKIKELEEQNLALTEDNEALRNGSKEEREDTDDNTENLQATIESQREDIQMHLERAKSLEEELMEKTIELNVLNANFAVLEEKLKAPSRKPLFATTTNEDVSALKDQLEEARKKSKHLDKQLNDFMRMSDLHASVVELTEENEELQQKITELEDEKGQLQLKLVSGERTEIVTEIEIEKKIEYLEATCQNQTSAIQLLEEQKMDMTENLQTTKSELESARVVSEMESIQLEEQVITNLQKIEELQKENATLNKAVEDLREEKDSLSKKVDHYVAENMELLDKIEKLSKSSSSAESIEIVERLTQQDRLEIEAFNKRVEQEEARILAGGASGQQEIDPELSDSLVKLKEESSELMHRIELFTTERKEVLEKMELLTAENHEHLKRIEQLTDEKSVLEQSINDASAESETLKQKINEEVKEKETIRREIQEIKAEKSKITAELNSIVKAASINAPNDAKDLLDKCEIGLLKLNAELESYRKANDKNAKFNASKKLSKEAKNTHQQVTELLAKIKEAPTAAPAAPAVDEAKLDELQGVITDLRQELLNANTASAEKDTRISQLSEEISSLRSMSEEFDKLINDKEMVHEKQIEGLTRLRRELEAKIETYEAEMNILQDLISEQKRQLIESYTDSEKEMNKKMEELTERDEEISRLKEELKALQESSGQVGRQFSEDLQQEVDKLKEALSINKGLLAEQIDELTNKQETIDTLNDQIMELYKTMEENANKVIEKDDEIAGLQEQLKGNKDELLKLTKENEENKQVVDKLLLELHSQKSTLEQLAQLPALEEKNFKLNEENQTLEENLQLAELKASQLEQTVKDLEQRNKEQLDKLKKYAANLKKKVAQCHEFEAKIKNLEEKGVLDAAASEKSHLVESLQEQVQEKTSQLEKATQELESIKASANQQRDFLEESVLKAQDALDSVQYELLALREQVTQKNTQIEELNRALAERSQSFGASADQSQNLILQEQLNESSNKIQELMARIHLYESRQDEMKALHDLLNEKNDQINSQDTMVLEAMSDATTLREQLNEKDQAISELNAHIIILNQQLEQSSQLSIELSAIREEINAKEKEIEKQNKILDSTEDQMSALQEELNQRNSEIQRLNTELTRVHVSSDQASGLQDQLKEKDTKIEELTKDLKSKSLKFEKSKAIIKEKNREIQRLNQLLSKQVEEEHIVPISAPAPVSAQPPAAAAVAELEQLRKENAKLREESAAERAQFQETIARLETVHDGIQAKLQEDMSYIETLEQENNLFKDKICRLQECVATFEERRASMERRANLLDAQMQTRSDEHAKAEDELVYRLNMLSEHDDIIGQRLFEAQEENEHLSSRLDTLKADNATLQANYSKLEKEYAAFKEETTANTETENHSLRTQVAALDAEIQRLRQTYEAKLAAKHSEIDELENDLSEQLRTISNEKRSLTEELEKTRDDLSELKDEHVRLNETINSLEQAKADLERESTWIKMQNENLSQDQFELQELRMQSMQDKTELENLKHQIDTLAQNHEIELNALRTQIAELDSMRMQVGQNQTDDQVFIETENKRLTDLLAEKESIIENYQRQNLQLQMNALAARQAPMDPFASLTQSDDSAQVANLRDKCERLERELGEKQREIDHMRGEQQLMVPPPVAFFGAEQAAPSIFDEIVTVRHVDNLQGAAHSSHRPALSAEIIPEPVGNLQTIEDLQRNVSDLEKHAHDLENKLSHRNAAYEEVLRQLEELRRSSEAKLKEYEDRINELELKETTKAIESQIVPTNQAPSLDMFFKSYPEESPFETIIIPPVSTEPVVEEVIVPKKAYTCQPTEQLELDEGWGWGSEEAALEAKHFNATTSAASLLGPQQQLELKLQESQERIQELELERDRLEQQKQESQVKSGKLMKKLKEYKAKIDELNSQAAFRKSSSVESSDLDLAIQEEMKSQLKQLEEKLGEAKKQMDTAALEKDNLLKRIDVLTAGNERMAEMKERQDNDVQMYKSRLRELTEKVQKLEEWGGAASEAAAPPAPAEQTASPATQELENSNRCMEQRIQELLSEIEDISGDRSEMQAMLDEEKTNLQQAEQTIRSLQEKITRLENSAGSDSADLKFQLNEIKLENQNMKSQLTDAQEAVAREKHEKLEEINRLATQSEQLCAEIAKLQLDSAKAKELEVKLDQVSAEKHQLAMEIDALRMELTFAPPPTNPSDELKTQNAQLAMDFDSVMMQNQDLGREVERLQKAAQSAEEEVNRLKSEVDRLTAELDEVNDKNEQLIQEIRALRLEQSFSALDDEKSRRIVTLEQELRTLKDENEQLSGEVSRLRFTAQFNSKPDASFQNVERLSGEVRQLAQQLQTVTEKKGGLLKELQSLRSEHLTKGKWFDNEVGNLSAEIQLLNTANSHLQGEAPTTSRSDPQEQIQEKDLEIMRLKEQIEDLQAELQEQIEEKDLEIMRLKQRIEELQAEASAANQSISQQQIQEKDSEIMRLKQRNEELQAAASTTNQSDQSDLQEQIQEKDSEIMHLKHRIEDLMREDQTEKLVLEILTKNQEIHMLKMQIKNLEDDKQELEHNLSVQITQEMNTKRADATDSAEKLEALQRELDSLRSEKSDMEKELEVLNNHVLSSLEQEEKMKATVLELDMKNIEIVELRKSLETLKSQESAPDMSALNAQWEGVVDQRCNEIATMWRQHLEAREAEFEDIKNRLQQEIESLKTGRRSPSQQSNPDEDHTSASSSKAVSPDPDKDLIQKMQQALESQEMEIVSLKEQLAIRSAEYARLAAQYDPFKMQSTMSHSSGFSTDGTKQSNSALVPRSELDLALYMIHQRDMRCEELTFELVHLLEERDTLQLKLSNTLRQVEEIKNQGTSVVDASKGGVSTTAENPDNVKLVPAAPTQSDDLNQKLSQLHSVNHAKDKRLQEERDQRVRQMEKIQQDVAKMPSEALSELVGSDLSHSNQSPSSVLLNWLWGKPSGGQS